MASRTTATPNAYLLAILLIVRSASGVTFTFHYPPKPSTDSTPPSPFHTLARPPSSASSSTSNSSASSAASDDDRQSRTTLPDHVAGAAGTIVRTATERSDSGSRTRSYKGRRRGRKAEEEEKEDVVVGDPPWETVLGFKTEFLAGLLAPKASMCKTKFEMTVDDVVFLGFPLHVRPDGTWRKKKKRRRGSAGEAEEGEGEGEGEAEAGEGAEADDEADELGSAQGGMTMFHVVFVLNPPELEYHFRTQEIFDYVVKRFARALKYEQAKDGYVWREAGKINRLREKAVQEGMFCMRLTLLLLLHPQANIQLQNTDPPPPPTGISFSELWKQILEQSSLAYAISRIYTDISQSKIAHVFLNNNLGLSLQIPIVTETAVLPGLTDPQVPGLPLTTANSFGDEHTEGDSMLARHFTLLFLTDVDSILKDIATETTDPNNTLALFVKACKPSLSYVPLPPLPFNTLTPPQLPPNQQHLRHPPPRHPTNGTAPNPLAQSPRNPPNPPTRHLHRLSKRRHAPSPHAHPTLRAQLPIPPVPPSNAL